MQLTKRRENKAKAELANRPEKIEVASNEIIEVCAKFIHKVFRNTITVLGQIFCKVFLYYQTTIM
jgi:hypothetical protein